MTIRVVIADDHRVVRDGLRYLLSQEPDVEVIGEAGDGRQTVDVVAAARGAAVGTASLSPELLTRLTQALRRQPPPDPLQPLSPRERDVLRLIARGHSNRQIARDLVIGEQTVKTHVRSILTKLGLQDRVQAAIFALRHQARYEQELKNTQARSCGQRADLAEDPGEANPSLPCTVLWLAFP